MTFEEFRSVLYAHQAAGEYADGVALIKAHSAEFPDQQQRISYWHACLTTQLGQTEEALDILAAALEANHWFGPKALLQDGLLEPLRDSARFSQILAESEVRLLAALADSHPSRILFEPSPLPDGPLPVLFALHGNGGSAKAEAEQWDALAEQGWLVVLPQSSQLTGPDFYVWDDAELTEAEVCEHFREISAEYNLDISRIVLGGYSRGSLRSFELALNSDIPATGYIGICPPLRHLSDLDSLAAAAAQKPAIHITTGDRNRSLADCESAVNLFTAQGFNAELKTFDADQRYPTDMAETLNQAIAFVTTQS